jgi:hypothetical protein
MLRPSSPDPVQATDLETIVAILRKQAQQANVKLPKDEAFYIALDIQSSVRALELTLKGRTAHPAFAGTQITLAYTQQLLKEVIEAQAREAVDLLRQKQLALLYGAKQPEARPYDLPPADRDFVFLSLKIRQGRKISQVRRVLEVNMRERERESLARRDPYERYLERSVRRKQN